MKKLFLIEDTLTNRITYYHILLFLIFLPFDRFYSEIILISLGMHTLIHLKKKNARKMPWNEVLILQSLFLLTLVSLFYTNNIPEGFSLCTRQTAILIFPLLLYVSPITWNQYRTRILSVFSITCTFTVLYLYIDAYRAIRFNHLGFSSLFSPYFINHNFSSPIGLHATYLSMYIGLCLMHLLVLMHGSSIRGQKLIILAGMIILSAGLVQLASRSVLISILLAGTVAFPFFFLKRKRRLRYIITAGLVSLLISFGIFYAPSFRTRYITEVKNDLENEKIKYGITDSRMQRWKVALELVKESPAIGHGSGDEVQLLREKYFNNGFYNAYIFKLNAHNQYLSLLIKSGIVGLLLYLFILFYVIRVSINSHDFVFFSFLVILATVSLSENYLDVNKGIFFYAFFFSFFLVSRRTIAPFVPSKKKAGNLKQTSNVFTC